jgi:imidazoleglycerol-phosphate dehydratase
VPLDEALVRAVVDVSGRAFLHFDVPLPPDQPRIGEFDARWRRSSGARSPPRRASRCTWTGFAAATRTTWWRPTFKAAARALGAATRIDPARADEVPSTKGAL